MSARYYEDFAVGDVMETQRYTLTREEALEFAQRYDPQSFHLDDEAAAASFFGRLVASGWQTASITMRLIVQAGAFEGGVVGAGVDQLRWTVPVVPGDTLYVRSEVIEMTPHPGGKPRGYVRFRTETLRDDQTVVMSQVTTTIVPRRP
jgi:acyl dehydratase